jgi:catalase
MAERVLYQSDDSFIQDDQLWHLARLKSKSLQQISPIVHQLCIPKSFRMKIMHAIHDFSHYSFLKCYLTSGQRFY